VLTLGGAIFLLVALGVLAYLVVALLAPGKF